MCPGDCCACFSGLLLSPTDQWPVGDNSNPKKSDRLVELKKLLPQKKSQTTESDGFFQKFKRSSCPETQDCVFGNVNFLPRGTPQGIEKRMFVVWGVVVCWLSCWLFPFLCVVVSLPNTTTTKVLCTPPPPLYPFFTQHNTTFLFFLLWTNQEGVLS